MQRGEIWWTDFDDPAASEPGYRRPVVIVQAESFLRSRISTVTVVVLSSNLHLADAPGNVLLLRKHGGLPKDSVANVSQIATVNRAALTEKCGRLGPQSFRAIEAGLRLALGL